MCSRRLEVGSLVYAPAAFSLPARPWALPLPTVETRVSVGATGVRAPSLCDRSHYLFLSRSLHLPPACTWSCAHIEQDSLPAWVSQLPSQSSLTFCLRTPVASVLCLH